MRVGKQEHKGAAIKATGLTELVAMLRTLTSLLSQWERKEAPGSETMQFELTEEQFQMKMSVREFAEAEIAPHVLEWDETQHFPVELLPKLADLGLLGILFPEEYGGAGLGYVEYATAIEELSRVDGSVGISVAAHNSLCSNHIFQFGTEAQKQKYLAPLARGEHLGAWGLTEPGAGSDASGARST